MNDTEKDACFLVEAMWMVLGMAVTAAAIFCIGVIIATFFQDAAILLRDMGVI